MKNYIYISLLIVILSACNSRSDQAPVIGFVDSFEDATIAEAREGFVDALADSGFSEKKNSIHIIYRNAQGDIPTLTQIINYFIAEKVDLLATCTTLSTVAALQRTSEIPVCMIAYIDTSFSLIPALVKRPGKVLKVGMIYNQSEPQSVDAFKRIELASQKLNVQIEALPLNNSADAQLVTQSLLNKDIDAFFANPDNSVFASFETILRNCSAKNVPVFTSESGLVRRGAVLAFGADMYKWGYQSGQQAVKFLKSRSLKDIKWEIVRSRNRVYNSGVANKYGIKIPDGFIALK